MRITKKQLQLLIESFINEDNNDQLLDTAQNLSADAKELSKYAERSVDFLKDHVEPSNLEAIRKEFQNFYQNLESSSPGLIKKLESADALTSAAATKIRPWLKSSIKGLKFLSGLLLPIAAFSAAPLALYKTIENLSSVEGKIREQSRAVKNAYNRKLELDDIADKSGAFAEVSTNLGIKPLTKNEIINALALDYFKEDNSSVLQRLINDEIISEKFAQEIYSRVQALKVSQDRQKELVKTLFGVNTAQPYHNISIGYAASLLGSITSMADVGTVEFITQTARDYEEYLEALNKLSDAENPAQTVMIFTDLMSGLSKSS